MPLERTFQFINDLALDIDNRNKRSAVLTSIPDDHVDTDKKMREIVREILVGFMSAIPQHENSGTSSSSLRARHLYSLK